MELKNSSKSLVITLSFCLVSALSAVAQTTGSFKGKIIEQSTKQPIIGATVQIDETSLGGITDADGVFEIRNIPIGNHSSTISYIGFQTKNITDIIIGANKTYYMEIELLEDVLNLNEVTVQAYRGEQDPLTPVSSFSYSREEIFRNPGAQGDIMRALSSLPGVVSGGSQFSAIAARGQGTQDNVYMVDDIPIFNLSHLEAEGFNSGFNDPNGGRFSIFAPRVIDNVQFQNGGFDAVFGRRSSSLLSLGVKEGNKETWSFSGQFDLLGATLIADGPVSEKTSVFASARYQNFNMLIRLLGEQQSSVWYSDFILKTTTELNSKNKLSVVAMFNPESTSRTIDDLEPGIAINDDNSGRNILWNHERNQAVVGLNLRTLVNSSSFLRNVLYYRSASVDNNFGEFHPTLDADGSVIDPTGNGYEEVIRHITNNQQEIGYRSIYTRNFDNLTLIAGIDAMVLNLEYERRLSETDTVYTFYPTDFRQSPTQYFQILEPSFFNSVFDNNAFNGSGYSTLSWKVTNNFVFNTGIRYDYSGFTEQHTVSPRLSGSIALSAQHSVNFATGIYYQDAAYRDIAGQSESNTLSNERSVHSILGYKYQISGEWKLVVEGWHKQFDDVVVQPNRFQSYLTNVGDGYAYGADISLIKRLSNNYYGQISYSFMQSLRDNRDGLGDYDYVFNIPHTINLLGSYKPNDHWVFSGKFRYSTGRPTDDYMIHSDVFNDPEFVRYGQEITAVNGARLPDFISLDIRVDYNVLSSWGTFSAFVDLVNVSNRFNVNAELFIPETGVISDIGLGVFPTFGVRIEL